MSSGDEVLRAVQKALGPYLKPREEVARIRRILALHLDSCLHDGSARSPLALVEASGVEIPSETTGLHQRYLKDLETNIKARTEYDAARRANGAHITKGSLPGGEARKDFLEEHLAKIQTQQKLAKLQTIEKHLDLLDEKPAASSRFLHPDEIFKDSEALPNVPEEVVDGIALDDSAGTTDLQGLIDKLEKHVLRAQLLLNNEQRLLEDAKACLSIRPEKIETRAKLDALSATRDELIKWMEAELAKASGDGGEETDEQKPRRKPHTIEKCMEEQLSDIKNLYSNYLETRKSLIQLVDQAPRPTFQPPAQAVGQETAAAAVPEPVTYLLVPYLETLSVLAHEQKGLIAEKSHLNIAIAKQLKENSQVLDHLAEESQLLPSHPLPGTSRRNRGLGDGGSENIDATNRIKRWVFASDSAKIATLETVAERIEEGQLALEGSGRILEEIDQLLGRRPKQGNASPEASLGEDIWMTQGESPAKSKSTRRHTEQKQDSSGGVWDLLHGNLGLLKSEDDTS